MTTNQGTVMASLNDEASVEDAALTDHENEEALDSPIVLLEDDTALAVAEHVAATLVRTPRANHDTVVAAAQAACA
jgi:hypothetical protein